MKLFICKIRYAVFLITIEPIGFFKAFKQAGESAEFYGWAMDPTVAADNDSNLWGVK